jgi:hypothetical protein
MTLSKIQYRVAGICAITLAMAACGDGGSLPNAGNADQPPVAQTPPVAQAGIPFEATQNAAAAFTFVNGVASSEDNSGEGLVVGDEILATTDTQEPDPSV